MTAGGCQKAPKNGWLDGMWEVKQVTVGDKVIEPRDRIFYNFYMDVCSLSYYGGPYTDANMIYDGETLYLDFPYARDEHNMGKLRNYGIYTNPVTFYVHFETDERLILRDGDIVVSLIKF